MTLTPTVFLLSVFLASASPQTAQLTLGGIVINSKTGEPLSRALVQIRSFNQLRHGPSGDAANTPTQPFVATTFTDAAGVFHFTALDAGTYLISADKPEFTLQRDNQQSLNVQLTASKGDVQLKLSPLGVITGKVVDQDGVPLRAVNVIALSMQTEDGWRHTQSTRSASTDDRGMYRFWNMSPGKYFIKAAGRSGGTFSYIGDATPQYFADESFNPAYFGGGQTLASASPVEIQPGTEMQADLLLKLEPAYKIRGTLANYVPRRAVKFELLSGDEDVSPSRVSVNSDTGRFEIQDVVAGSYLLHAVQDQASASLPVSVNGVDINGVALSLAPAVDVKGSTRFTNPVPDMPSEFQGIRRQRFQMSCMVNLNPPGTRALTRYNSETGENGDFTIKQVMAGTYRVAVTCPGGYANSAMSGSQDLLANPILTIQPGVAPAPIEILAAHGGGTIQGKISVPAAKDDRLQVLLVPQFAATTGPSLVVSFPSGEDSGGWRFVASGLAPGTYAVYVFPGTADVEFRNPQFLQSLRGGTSVQVADKAEAQVAITEIIR